GKLSQGVGNGRRGCRALVAQEAAILEPDGFGGAKEWEGVQRFLKPGDGAEGFVHIVDARVDRLMVHAAQLLAPLLEKLAGAVFDGEVVGAANQTHRWSGAGVSRGGLTLFRCRHSR